jgi:multisubunit Na+/H+ antiporter MnhE subunit
MQLTFGWCIIGGVFICGSLQTQQLPLTFILSALYVLMVRSHFHGHMVICNRGRFVGYHRIFLLPYMYSISICNLLCCHPFLAWSMEIVPSMEMHFFLMQIVL